MNIFNLQVTNPDFYYKKMGLIGTLKIVSCFGDATKSNICPVSSHVRVSLAICSISPKNVNSVTLKYDIHRNLIVRRPWNF